MPADESCALDVASLGALPQRHVGRMFGGLTEERIRQIERKGEKRLKENGVELRDLLDAYNPSPRWETQSEGRSLGEVAEEDGYREVEDLADRTEREARELEAWALSAFVLVRAGISPRRAWQAANDQGNDDEDDMTKSERKATHRIETLRKRGARPRRIKRAEAKLQRLSRGARGA